MAWRECGAEGVEIVSAPGETLCTFAGDVDVSWQAMGGNVGIERWTCPVCGTGHEEEIGD